MMKDFMLVFRADYDNMRAGTPEEREAMSKRWMEWIHGIAGQNKLAERGNRLTLSGKVLRGQVVTDGPYAEIKESIGGYTIIKAESYDEAIELAKPCPILTVGGNVEIREVSVL
jgi:hypothetical protein